MHEQANFLRTVILGNSGSGKSWLSRHLSGVLACKAIDLDGIHWEPGSYSAARDRQIALELVQTAAVGERWVIEGAYGWLAAEALPRATALVWCAIPVEECLVNLRQRGVRRGGDAETFAALLDWAGGYATRQTSSSHAGHERMFQGFHGRKVKLSTRQDFSDLLGAIRPPGAVPGPG